MRYIASIIISFLTVEGVPANAQTIVPFSLDDNLVHVAMTVNGHAASGVLDSGTGGVGLDTHYAATFGLQHGGKIGSVSGGGQKEQVAYAGESEPTASRAFSECLDQSLFEEYQISENAWSHARTC
ncbi:hypothetical protein [Gluconacetobacter tumulisoli]|uniref:Uncharacterized protein n=1 Tax=Gluconacetobacter tumulisoli TaxID=1286189 RepID=A0A7W4K5E1_9PROT|nr:hypothetical protein [Gluconacetobacter tumulisoli]MBB2200697.1 hypothetical protein [Gluconacetobacter tumulisoli]